MNQKKEYYLITGVILLGTLSVIFMGIGELCLAPCPINDAHEDDRESPKQNNSRDKIVFFFLVHGFFLATAKSETPTGESKPFASILFSKTSTLFKKRFSSLGSS